MSSEGSKYDNAIDRLKDLVNSIVYHSDYLKAMNNLKDSEAIAKSETSSRITETSSYKKAVIKLQSPKHYHQKVKGLSEVHRSIHRDIELKPLSEVWKHQDCVYTTYRFVSKFELDSFWYASGSVKMMLTEERISQGHTLRRYEGIFTSKSGNSIEYVIEEMLEGHGFTFPPHNPLSGEIR